MAALPKRKRATLSLREKLKILDRLQTGESASAIGREFGLGESTIRGIKLNEGKIRKSAECAVGGRISYVRDPILEKTEKTLFSWVEESNERDVPLSASRVRSEALKLYRSFIPCKEGEADSKYVFRASKGWLERFKTRYGLDNVKIGGEIEVLEPLASNDEEIQRIVAAHADDGDVNHEIDSENVADRVEEAGAELIGDNRKGTCVKRLKSEFVPASSPPGSPANLNLEAVSELLRKREEMMKIVELDSNLERAMQFRKALDEAVAPYIDLQRKLCDDTNS